MYNWGLDTFTSGKFNSITLSRVSHGKPSPGAILRHEAYNKCCDDNNKTSKTNIFRVRGGKKRMTLITQID